MLSDCCVSSYPAGCYSKKRGQFLPQTLQQPAAVLFRTPALYRTTACFYHSFEEVEEDEEKRRKEIQEEKPRPEDARETSSVLLRNGFTAWG
jgi:hypothetical protein